MVASRRTRYGLGTPVAPAIAPLEAGGSSVADFTAYIKSEEARFAKVLKETGVKLD